MRQSGRPRATSPSPRQLVARLALAVLAALLLAPAARAALQPFQCFMPDGSEVFGDLLVEPEGITVDAAWRFDGVSVTPLALGLRHDAMTFAVRPLVEGQVLLVGTARGTTIDAVDTSFFSLQVQAHKRWYPYVSETFENVDEAIDESAQQGEPECDPPPPAPGEDRFVYKLGSTTVIVIIYHADGTVEMLVYSQDANGCWHFYTYPVGPPPPGPSPTLVSDVVPRVTLDVLAPPDAVGTDGDDDDDDPDEVPTEPPATVELPLAPANDADDPRALP